MSIDIDHPNEKLIPQSGDLTIQGNEIITGLSASQVVVTDASKRLASGGAAVSSSDLFEAALVY
jgi:hypothetical protein